MTNIISEQLKKYEESKEQALQMKECPFCAENIKKNAKKCKHCGEIIDVVLRAADEAKGSSNVYMNAGGGTVAESKNKEVEEKHVGAILGIGIVCFPILALLVVLGKGYSDTARIISFLWLLLVIAVASSA